MQNFQKLDKLQGCYHESLRNISRPSSASHAAVALIGPRQVGKITLALAIGRAHDALYLDLENRDDRNRLANPVPFFENFEDRLIILDEIHRMPELF